MDKFREYLNACMQTIDRVRNMINIQRIPSNAISCNELYNALYQLIPLIPQEYCIFRDRLRDKILPNLKTPDLIFMDQHGRPFARPQNGINPYSFGEVIATITYLNGSSNNNPSSIWENIHPQIVAVSKARFNNEHYADAVEAAFKEINTRVKKIYKDRTSVEKDGAKLMLAAFSVQNPIIKLGDISTETGTNIQQGYMEMFAGAMIGIRNPQAHNNLLITRDNAIRELHFASMLMYKIDDELV
ncbi:MAG: TIGR02391 family protein [Alphaproteobacteria bacterium]|nr:TIGR02391 family protein [Alphaproteobacteria bacterium]